VKFEAIIEATPKPTISWLLNGKELTNKDGVQVEKDVNNNRYCLSIPKIVSNIHAGTVTIVAKNSLGTVQHDIVLNING
jgi:hypothetical protein